MSATGAQGPALAWRQFPAAPATAAIAETALDEAWIACANIGSPMRSAFTWTGERGEAEEVGVPFKTVAAGLEAPITRFGELHPGDDLAIPGWHGGFAHLATAQWLAAPTS